ncbi:DUF4282 domain-containing protein [bacterium]|nr:MAG: DUF4282 domain-containing protein [bacterium]
MKKRKTLIKDFFAFNEMISLMLIKFIYIAGIVAVIGWGISLMINGNIVNIIAGVLVLIFGNLFWRICCESWILFFSMHDLVKKTEKHLNILSDSIKR